MGNENDTNVRSLRIDDESYEKFQTLSKECKNQAQAFSSLISVYELEKSKDIIPERQKEIETFAIHIQKINEIYNHSLLLTHDAEIRIKSEFEKQLDSKDATILDLQEKTKRNEAIKQENEEQKQRIMGLEKEIDMLNSEKIKSDGIIKSLTETTTEYKEQAKESQSQKKQISEMQNQLTELTYKNTALTTENQNKLQEFEKTTAAHQKELEAMKKKCDDDVLLAAEKINLSKEKELLVIEQKYNKQMNEIHESYQKRIEELLKQLEQPKQEQPKQEQPQVLQTTPTKTKTTTKNSKASASKTE